MQRCPFYGVRWPERSPKLFSVGGDECGLDWGKHGRCQMAAGGQTINYFCCPLALSMKDNLRVASRLIEFPARQAAL